MINAGERLIVNNRSFGYLSNRIVFYLLNLHIKSRRTYFARVCDSSRLNHTCTHFRCSNRKFRLVFRLMQTRIKRMPPCPTKARIMLKR